MDIFIRNMDIFFNLKNNYKKNINQLKSAYLTLASNLEKLELSKSKQMQNQLLNSG